MENLTFLNKETGQPSKNCQKFHKGWVTTLKSYKLSWPSLKRAGFQLLNMRLTNQDMEENAFFAVRNNGAFNTNPSCLQFQAALKNGLINSLVSSSTKSKNCKEDNADLLIKNLKQLLLSSAALHSSGEYQSSDEISDEDSEVESASEEVAENMEVLVQDDIDLDIPLDKAQTLARVAGYLAKEVGVGKFD